MALDTASKRGSSLNFFRGNATLPLPDGTIDDGDRQHALGCYSGIPSDAPSAATPLQRYRRPPWRVKGIFK